MVNITRQKPTVQQVRGRPHVLSPFAAETQESQGGEKTVLENHREGGRKRLWLPPRLVEGRAARTEGQQGGFEPVHFSGSGCIYLFIFSLHIIY